MSQIITLDDLNSYTSQMLDSGTAQQVVDGVNRWIETRTGRVWGETVEVTERCDLGRALWLQQMDVVAVASIKLGYPGQSQTTLDVSDYFFNAAGRVTLLTATPSRGGSYNEYVEVTYTHGNETVPDDLRHAALGLAHSLYNAAKNDQKDVSEVQVGSYHVKYSGGGQSADAGSTSPIAQSFSTIDTYRKRRV